MFYKLVPLVYMFQIGKVKELSEKKIIVSENCHDAVKRLHEVMKLLDMAKIDLGYKEKRYSIAIAFFTLWVGFAFADVVAAATVVYSIGPATGVRTENVFWNPEGADFMNFTWFGLALVISVAFSLIFLYYSRTCSLSRQCLLPILTFERYSKRSSRNCLIFWSNEYFFFLAVFGL